MGKNNASASGFNISDKTTLYLDNAVYNQKQNLLLQSAKNLLFDKAVFDMENAVCGTESMLLLTDYWHRVVESSDLFRKFLCEDVDMICTKIQDSINETDRMISESFTCNMAGTGKNMLGAMFMGFNNPIQDPVPEDSKGKNTVQKINEQIDEEFGDIQTTYHFTYHQIQYLKEHDRDQLEMLRVVQRFSSADANKICSQLKEKAIYVGIIDQYNLTDEQFEIVNNLELLIGSSPEYTKKRVGEMQVTAAALLSAGESPEFVAAVLGNVIHEGGVANIENAAYSEGNEPWYLKNIIKYAQENGEKNFKDKYSGWDNYLYDNISYNEYKDFMSGYIDSHPPKNTVWGCGQCQWTDADRLNKLLERYDYFDNDKDGKLSYSEAMLAEADMIVFELQDEASSFKDVDNCISPDEISDNYQDNEELVRQGALTFREEYERSASPEPERGDSAVEIYQAMMGA